MARKKVVRVHVACHSSYTKPRPAHLCHRKRAHAGPPAPKRSRADDTAAPSSAVNRRWHQGFVFVSADEAVHPLPARDQHAAGGTPSLVPPVWPDWSPPPGLSCSLISSRANQRSLNGANVWGVNAASEPHTLLRMWGVGCAPAGASSSKPTEMNGPFRHYEAGVLRRHAISS